MASSPATVDGRAAIRTPDQRLRVFVSSTLHELADERRAARAAIEQLRLAPVMFELGARPHPPQDLYRAYLEQSEVFVGLYAESYGWVAPDDEISGLEDEYRLVPDGMPKLIYLKEPASERQPRLTDLIHRIRADDTASYKSFSTPEELGDLLASDLATLLAERFDASRSAAPAPEAGVRPRSGRTPAPYTALIGRTREVDDLLRLLRAGDDRLVTVLGPGGIGKSRLAIEVADAAEPFFDDGTVFVPLENVLEPALLLPTIAYALGIRDTGEIAIEDRLALALADQQLLIVLDNFEQLVESADVLVRLYSMAPRATLLVTSRSVLRIRGERIYEVGPLPNADPERATLERAAVSPAVALFVERARAMRPDFALTEGNAETLVRICAALDGVPLAIELTAARIRVLTPSAILERLGAQLALLAGAARDVPERQRTVRATIEWSIGPLADAQRELLMDLGVFASDFTLEAVQALRPGSGDTALDDLAALVDNSLVMQRDVGGEVVFSLLATVREFAVEQLDRLGTLERTRDAHADHYLDLARRMAPLLKGPRQSEAAARLGLERGNLRAAVRHLVAARRDDDAAGFAWSLYVFWWIGGFLGEVRTWMREVLDSGAPLSDFSRAVAEYYVLWMRMWSEPSAEVVAGFEDASRRFAASGDEAAAAVATAAAAMAMVSAELDLDRAAVVAEQTTARLLEVDDGWAAALTHVTLGRIEWLRDRPEDALERFRRGIAISREYQDVFTTTVMQHHVGRALLFTGRTDEAEAEFRQALELSAGLGHDEGIAYALEGLSAVASLHGDGERAGVLSAAAAAMRHRVAAFDSPRFVYHLQFLEACRERDPDLVSAAEEHGRLLTPAEAVAFALGEDSFG